MMARLISGTTQADEAKRQVEACAHISVVRETCLLCGALRGHDGQWEAPLRPSGIWNPKARLWGRP